MRSTKRTAQESGTLIRVAGVPKPGQNWKLTISYDGSRFAGWQVQPGRCTVQGTMQAAIARVVGEPVLPQGSGRTDAGVHALGQVCSFALAEPIPPVNLARALNHALPPSVRVLGAEHAPPGFHARHRAVRKTYEYRVFRAPLCPPWLAPYVLPWTFPCALGPMREAAALLTGERDFRSFAAADPDKAARASGTELSTVRTILASDWEEQPGDLLVYRVTGSGFLHHMVRNLAGTLLLVGRGLLAPGQLPRILEARDRRAAGPTAPASGLWLHSVEY